MKDHMAEHTGTKRESGQAIVLMALMMVALLAFTGLAVDGGGFFLLYREARNASDASVLAASYARCTKSDSVIEAGMSAARINGFNNDQVDNWVTINHPPVSGAFAGNPAYVSVNITANKPSYFIQVVYPEQIQVSVTSIGRCVPPFNPTEIPAVFATSRECGTGLDWTGAGAYVEGGLFSNSGLQVGGGGQGNDIHDDYGNSGAVGSVADNEKKNTWYSGGQEVPPPPGNQEPKDDMLADIFVMADYAPGGAVARAIQAMPNGKYTAIMNTSAPDTGMQGGTLTWSPSGQLEGLYYVNGDVKMRNSVTFHPNGATIVATGDIDPAGSGHMKYYPAAGGIIFMTSVVSENCGRGSTGRVSLSSNNITFTGLVYAPRASIKISGSGITIVGALIGHTIDFSGSSLYLIYDPEMLSPRPPSVMIAD